GRDADHVVLRDADLEEPLRVLLLEQVRVVRLHEVPVQHDDAGILPHADQGLAERLPGRLRHQWAPPESASNRRRDSSASIVPSSSAMAISACFASGAFPCQSGFSSIQDTPFPLTVCATIIVGWSPTDSASSSASRISSMSWPLISRTCHPKARHFATTGSMSRMSTTFALCWTWFLS